jgi:hypothetical protein
MLMATAVVIFRRQLPTILADDPAGILITAHGGNAAYHYRRVLYRSGICRAVLDQRALHGDGISYNMSAALFGGTAPVVETWMIKQAHGMNTVPALIRNVVRCAIVHRSRITRSNDRPGHGTNPHNMLH